MSVSASRRGADYGSWRSLNRITNEPRIGRVWYGCFLHSACTSLFGTMAAPPKTTRQLRKASRWINLALRVVQRGWAAVLADTRPRPRPIVPACVTSIRWPEDRQHLWDLVQLSFPQEQDSVFVFPRGWHGAAAVHRQSLGAVGNKAKYQAFSCLFTIEIEYIVTRKFRTGQRPYMTHSMHALFVRKHTSLAPRSSPSSCSSSISGLHRSSPLLNPLMYFDFEFLDGLGQRLEDRPRLIARNQQRGGRPFFVL